MLGVDNKKYYDLIKSENAGDIQDYKIKLPKDKDSGNEVTLKNIRAIRLTYNATINANNIFTFNTALFSKNDYNYKLDIWTNSNQYDNNKDYIDKIINTIDFIEKPKTDIDSTTDTPKANAENH